MKIRKMYIVVPHENGKMTLHNASKIKELTPYIPSEEAIVTNVKLQVAKWEKDHNYKPEPLFLNIPLDVFLIVKARVPGIGNEIALNSGANGVPTVILIPRKKEDDND